MVDVTGGTGDPRAAINRLRMQLTDVAGRAERIQSQATQMESEAVALADAIDCLLGGASNGLDIRLVAQLTAAAESLRMAASSLDGAVGSVTAYRDEL